MMMTFMILFFSVFFQFSCIVGMYIISLSNILSKNVDNIIIPKFRVSKPTHLGQNSSYGMRDIYG